MKMNQFPKTIAVILSMAILTLNTQYVMADEDPVSYEVELDTYDTLTDIDEEYGDFVTVSAGSVSKTITVKVRKEQLLKMKIDVIVFGELYS